MTDVCFILEGTYPYKTGGVTTWLHSLIQGLPEISFSVAHLYYGPEPSSKKVQVPSNVVDISLIPLNGGGPAVSVDRLTDLIPEAKVYHALSTGFAGFLGTEMKRRSGRPFILTEHGIYWHEVSLGVDELECGFKIVKREVGDLNLGYTWESWSETFRGLARQAYASADVITTVCAFNRSLQQSIGAPEGKIQVIPNGVRVSQNGSSLHSRASIGRKPRVALVGRVTPMKDIKTFIRACALVREEIPEADFLVIGPTDHDPAYATECMSLAKSLGLESLVFTGEVDVEKLYPTIDVVVLTSVSEAQPYAILESFAHGIPVVVTDVGGCPELVQSNGSSDASAGYICSVGDHRRVADAVTELCTNGPLYAQYSQEGLKQAREKYSYESTIDSFRQIYKRSLNHQE